MLELRRLALLHQFAVHGTIAATAAASGYSASAVSQQLSVLEREVGRTLLERTARSATLTEAGHTLAAHAAVILDAAEAAEADLAGTSVRGRVVVSTIPTAAAAWASALIEVSRAHPDLELVVHQHSPDEALRRLRTRETDLAVVDEWSNHIPREPGLHRRELHRDPLYLTGDPAGGTWLCAPPDQPSRPGTDRLLRELGIEPAVRWEFDGLPMIAALVARGAGAAILPGLALAGTGLPATPLDRHRRIDAVLRQGSRTRPAITAVLNALHTFVTNTAKVANPADSGGVAR
ncbi:LysR substrate-binding domain-containing protein [Amycolatopsis albispora]|nr:LysR substrate-binding domain-containing protein [Amycolatopsis albispora]